MAENKILNGLNFLEKKPILLELEKTSENLEDKKNTLLSKKIEGAIFEIGRRLELDIAIEKNLSSGLTDKSGFLEACQKIDDKRKLTVTKLKSFLRKDKTDLITEMKVLENKITDPFTKEVYQNFSDKNKDLLIFYLVDNPINRNESQIISNYVINDLNHNIVHYSDNGFLMQLVNPQEIRQEDGLAVYGDKDLYNLITPDGKLIAKDLNYETALEDLKKEAEKYRQELIEKFNQNQKEKSLVEDFSAIEIYSNNLNNKTDSVWRLTREIFKNNPEKLGYKGQIVDQLALDNWAEVETAKAIETSGNLSDKVFSGYHVVLKHEAGQFKIAVDLNDEYLENQE